MRDEPKSELARYAYGFSLFWLLLAIAVLSTLGWLFATLMASPAEAACHRYSVWTYPWPQPRCSVLTWAQVEAPSPPQRPLELELSPSDLDIPLPSLEGMEFPPDCMADWCDRLKGVGLLRDKLRTN